MKVILVQNEKNIATCVFSKRWLLPLENNILADELLLMDLMHQDFSAILKSNSSPSLIREISKSDSAPYTSNEEEILLVAEENGKFTPKFINEHSELNTAVRENVQPLEEAKYL
jgi:hypothetical protein